ncbi:hypothetical protein BJF79_31895 [Actinomadura sp. CNU-125]|uniref:MFS transporter n=1 Tax=Actinomadura sp. CNU-125 TaxID=1904961 RepID=UPI000958F2A5|nr:MFS transporter [Actinomadura sp. CNU-125]OLT35764.1 hypothetical protein BJF79_31895 [Actinomadura sp. CNU-125]
MTSKNPGTVTAPDPRRWAGLAVLSASLLLVVMDITILNVALPAISADLRPSNVALLWMVDVYALVVAGLLVTVSALGDRWGRKRMLIAGFAVFGTASILVVFADTPGAVIAVRALLGVGGAMIMPSTLSMIRTLFPDGRERATALGVWGAMAAVGAAFGPILGGFLLEHFSWHSAFLVNVPVMAVAIVAGLFLLPEARDPRPGPLDFPAVALSMAGMVALVYAIKSAGKYGVADPAALLPAAVAAVALGWFVRRSLRRPDPLIELRLFRSPSFTAGAVTAMTTELSMAGTMLLMAQWMQLVQGYGPLETGLRLLPMALGAIVASPTAPAVAARIGARTVLAAASRSPRSASPSSACARAALLPAGRARAAADRAGRGLPRDRLRRDHGGRAARAGGQRGGRRGDQLRHRRHARHRAARQPRRRRLPGRPVVRRAGLAGRRRRRRRDGPRVPHRRAGRRGRRRRHAGGPRADGVRRLPRRHRPRGRGADAAAARSSIPDPPRHRPVGGRPTRRSRRRSGRRRSAVPARRRTDRGRPPAPGARAPSVPRPRPRRP